jgi:hypothetical protein
MRDLVRVLAIRLESLNASESTDEPARRLLARQGGRAEPHGET